MVSVHTSLSRSSHFFIPSSVLMASGSSAGLALKAAAVSAVLVMLVLPALGRCPSLGPAPPPPPVPAPAPAPAPRVSCHECYSSTKCLSSCRDSIRLICKECDDIRGRCDRCRAAEIGKCTAKCTGSCECDGVADNSCITDCSYDECSDCVYGQDKRCLTTCRAECSSTCVGP